MKEVQRLSYCSIPCVLFLITLISNSLASDVFFEDAIEDGAYLRREHCLTKPYHGKKRTSDHVGYPTLTLELTCFCLPG